MAQDPKNLLQYAFAVGKPKRESLREGGKKKASEQGREELSFWKLVTSSGGSPAGMTKHGPWI